MTLQWYSPTCYHEGVNPLDLGLGVKTCSAAAHNMTVQPDARCSRASRGPSPWGIS